MPFVATASISFAATTSTYFARYPLTALAECSYMVDESSVRTWDPLLQLLTAVAPRFITDLIVKALGRVCYSGDVVSASADIDEARLTATAWTVHLLQDSCWSPARRRLTNRLSLQAIQLLCEANPCAYSTLLLSVLPATAAYRELDLAAPSPPTDAQFDGSDEAWGALAILADSKPLAMATVGDSKSTDS